MSKWKHKFRRTFCASCSVPYRSMTLMKLFGNVWNSIHYSTLYIAYLSIKINNFFSNFFTRNIFYIAHKVNFLKNSKIFTFCNSNGGSFTFTIKITNRIFHKHLPIFRCSKWMQKAEKCSPFFFNAFTDYIPKGVDQTPFIRGLWFNHSAKTLRSQRTVWRVKNIQPQLKPDRRALPLIPSVVQRSSDKTLNRFRPTIFGRRI